MSWHFRSVLDIFLDLFLSVEQLSFDLVTLKMRVVALPVSLGDLSRLVLKVELWSFDARTLTEGGVASPLSLGYPS